MARIFKRKYAKRRWIRHPDGKKKRVVAKKNGKRRCDACRHEFRHAPPGAAGETADTWEGPPVPYLRTACPACGASDNVILATRGPVRRHQCRFCGTP